ncbi:MAG: hypothetical protein PHW76_03220 [Alphaproteobacteria bacterium]|nr:hypothetical protein [Alphaproteobacteria bacterium]
MNEFSSLPKTWIFDLDGTLVKHNGYLNGGDVLLEGVREFFETLPPDDKVVIITARTETYKEQTLLFLKENSIRFNDILFDYPTGERILVNDNKPSGLKMAYAFNLGRDAGLALKFTLNEAL